MVPSTNWAVTGGLDCYRNASQLGLPPGLPHPAGLQTPHRVLEELMISQSLAPAAERVLLTADEGLLGTKPPRRPEGPGVGRERGA